jgi:hypothetical protein
MVFALCSPLNNVVVGYYHQRLHHIIVAGRKRAVLFELSFEDGAAHVNVT